MNPDSVQLYLDGNQIGDGGSAAFAKALAANRTLTKVYCAPLGLAK